MIRSLFKLNWKNSPAYLLFLSKFLSPSAIDEFSKSNIWKDVLNESPEKAIKRFLDEKVVEQVELSGVLDYKFKVSDLKAMLRERGLTLSGRKAELIERLIEDDPNSMKQVTRGLIILQCSEQGRIIAEQYLTQEKYKKAKLEQEVLQTLQQGRFKEASLIVATFEAEQVFPRGINIDWKHHDPSRDIEMLKIIFSAKPKILIELNDEQMEHLHLAAGMMYILATNQAKDWLPDNFETELIIDNDTAARMIYFYASHQVELEQYRATGVKKVEVVASDDSCDACKKMAKRKYTIDKVPELPYEKCTSEMGCRCTML